VIDGAIYIMSSCLLPPLLCVTASRVMHLTPVFLVGHQGHHPPHKRTHANRDPDHLLEGNETGRVSGTDTGPSVLNGLV